MALQRSNEISPRANPSLRICLPVLIALSLAIWWGPAQRFSAAATGGAIRIGEIDPLTGKLANHGQEIHEGILYAVNEVNAQGGLEGLKVELISRDDQSQPEVAINQAEDLLYRDKVVGLVGGYVDSLVGPIRELAAKHRTPYVAAASLQTRLTLGSNNPYFFRVAHLNGIVDPLCRFVLDVLKPHRVAILYASTPGSTEFGGEVRACLEKANIEIPIVEKFRPGLPDFSTFLLKLRQAEVDVLISGGFFADHLVLVRQLREQNVRLRAYLGPWGIAYPNFVETMGAASEGLLGMCAWNPGISMPGTDEESKNLVDRFTTMFGKTPNTTNMHGYVSAKALLSAIEAVLKSGHELTGENIAIALRGVDLVTPMEHLKFDEKGDPEHYRQTVVQIQKGRLVPIFPPDRASAGFVAPDGA